MSEQFDAYSDKVGWVAATDARRSRQLAFSALLTLVGLVIGAVALALVSNRFGNTDTTGLLLLGLAGWFLVTGVTHLFCCLRVAALAGVIGAPLPAFLLFAMYWLAWIATALQNHNHQAFAANGVSQIQPARQMNELFTDCRHFITYGPNDVPLFTSAAYFGGRYKLVMRVPVAIESGASGSMIGEPQFYLHEVSTVTILPSGQVSASFSRSLDFGAAEWKMIYESDGDFSAVGFNLNPAPVANFQKYADASRPSN